MAHQRFVAYYRVSTKAQGLSGLGLEAQEAAVRQHLGQGRELLGNYTDIESGTRKGNQRPELAKAIARCRREKATLLIAKLDRLARNVHFVTGLMETGVEFIAADMPQANKLTIHIIAAVAEAEAEAISARTKAALAAAKARGTRLGKPENLTEAALRAGAMARRRNAIDYYGRVVHLVAILRGRGESLRAIARHLNELGEVTSSGAAFRPGTVHRILARAGAPGP
jgi:DNA invertase Pin-like site-specific DNA recombinase